MPLSMLTSDTYVPIGSVQKLVRFIEPMSLLKVKIYFLSMTFCHFSGKNSSSKNDISVQLTSVTFVYYLLKNNAQTKCCLEKSV